MAAPGGPMTVARFSVTRVDAITTFGLSDRTELSLDVPFTRIVRRPTAGGAQATQGLGDVRLSARRLFTQTDGFRLLGSVGVSVPTGQPKALTRASFLDPDEAQRLGVPAGGDTRLQLGTGVVTPTLGLQARQSMGKHFSASANVQTTLPFYPNRFGYRTSPSLSGQIGVGASLGEGDVALGLQLSGYYTGTDWFFGQDLQTVNGVLPGTLAVPNSRRFELGLRPSVAVRLGDVSIAVQGLVPVYTQPFAAGGRWATQPAGAYVESTLEF